MLHQINLLFRRFLTDARQLFRFFVIVNLIPCILLVFTEPYSFMGKVILVTFPLGMYLFTTDSCNHNRRDIDHTNQDDRRPQIIQQFTGFRHVGRRQVQKHIDSDHRFAEQVE